MDPITLILTALAAGAALGLQDTASVAVKDGYTALKTLVKRRFGGRPDAELVLAKHEQAPDIWQAPLKAELAEAGADSDPDLVEAAQALMRLIDPVGVRAGKYTVDVRGAQGVQIGDHNRQDNVFNAPQATEATGYDRPQGRSSGLAVGGAMTATSRRIRRLGVLGRSPSGRGRGFLLRIRGAGWYGSQAAASSLETSSVPPRITEAGGLYGQN